MATYIPDGYTERGYVEAVPRLHGAVRFRYRPVLVEESADFFEKGVRMAARESERATARMLEKSVVDWDVTDTEGKTVLPVSQSFLRLNRRLFLRMAGIVLGTEPSDQDPAWAEEEKAELDATIEKAKTDETTVGAAAGELNRKNS